jgi:hypothetical protein
MRLTIQKFGVTSASVFPTTDRRNVDSPRRHISDDPELSNLAHHATFTKHRRSTDLTPEASARPKMRDSDRNGMILAAMCLATFIAILDG